MSRWVDNSQENLAIRAWTRCQMSIEPGLLIETSVGDTSLLQVMSAGVHGQAHLRGAHLTPLRSVYRQELTAVVLR